MALSRGRKSVLDRQRRARSMEQREAVQRKLAPPVGPPTGKCGICGEPATHAQFRSDLGRFNSDSLFVRPKNPGDFEPMLIHERCMDAFEKTHGKNESWIPEKTCLGAPGGESAFRAPQFRPWMKNFMDRLAEWVGKGGVKVLEDNAYSEREIYAKCSLDLKLPPLVAYNSRDRNMLVLTVNGAAFERFLDAEGYKSGSEKREDARNMGMAFLIQTANRFVGMTLAKPETDGTMIPSMG